MIITLQKDWFKSLYDFLSQKTVYHFLLWLLYIGIMLTINFSSPATFFFTLVNVLIHSAFLAALVYINLLYLIPKFLSKKRIASYLGYLIFATMLATPLELICLYWNMSEFVEAQRYLIENQYTHFAFMLTAVSGSTVLKIAKEWLMQERIQRDLERRNLQSELSFLKSQINPHFLFNTLNSLYALTLKKSDKAPEIVLRLSEMMRYMLYECNEKRVPLEHEVQYIQNYLELERIRYGQKVKIEFEYLGDEPEGYEITPLLFIPFLENSFKHGISNSLADGFVKVSMKVSQNLLTFEIINNKGKAPVSELYYQGGIGLKNVKRRLELLYPNDYKLDIKEEEDTYIVELSVNLELEPLKK